MPTFESIHSESSLWLLSIFPNAVPVSSLLVLAWCTKPRLTCPITPPPLGSCLLCGVIMIAPSLPEPAGTGWFLLTPSDIASCCCSHSHTYPVTSTASLPPISPTCHPVLWYHFLAIYSNSVSWLIDFNSWQLEAVSPLLFICSFMWFWAGKGWVFPETSTMFGDINYASRVMWWHSLKPDRRHPQLGVASALV